MSSKNTKLAQRKQAKAVKRTKAKQAVALKKKHGNVVNKANANRQQLSRELVAKGVVALSSQLAEAKRDFKTKDLELTNTEVMKGIMDLINITGPLHGAIEVLDRLSQEGRFEFTDDEVAKITVFDKAAVKLTEDINAIVTLIEVGKQEPSDYIDLLIDHVNSSAVLAEEILPEIMDGMFGSKERKELVDEYVKEHKGDEQDNFEAGLRFHNERMERIYPLYKTVVSDEADIITVEDSESSATDPHSC